ncbi:hypothetical protein H6761_02655 [Candidatus Nomurabacteria bacterium]|nr:hypothetical protein [Candidatus Nomurabacteria bacterium]
MLENNRDLETTSIKSVLKNKVFWVFLLLSLAVLMFAFWYFKTQNLEKHFAVEVPDFIKETLLNDQQKNEQTIEDLKKKDTDGDGLTDFQEIYQYNTSIFLEDTDSDGYSDFEEVSSANDPLCPNGEDCNLLRLITPNTKLADVIEDVNVDGELTIQDAALQQFRVFLLDNGFKQEEVDSLSNDDLLYIFSILQESEIGQANLDNETTPEQVREFLLAQPNADEEEIKQLSEQQLLEIRNRLIQE